MGMRKRKLENVMLTQANREMEEKIKAHATQGQDVELALERKDAEISSLSNKIDSLLDEKDALKEEAEELRKELAEAKAQIKSLSKKTPAKSKK